MKDDTPLKSQIATSSDGAAPPIYTCRGAPVLIDADVARLFGVETRRLNEQVKRNAGRFGDDFGFQLDLDEADDLKSQIATSSGQPQQSHGGRRKPPFVFTEHGVVMAATLLRSDQAVTASRFIVKVFVEARRNQFAQEAGQNLPAMIDPRAVLPLASEMRHGLMAKLNEALGRVLDVMIDTQSGTTVRDEARALAAEGLQSLKEHLRKAGVQNEKTLAEVRKLLAEAEAIDAETAQKHTEQRHREFALVAKQLRLVLTAQQYLESGSVDGMLAVLKDLGQA